MWRVGHILLISASGDIVELNVGGTIYTTTVATLTTGSRFFEAFFSGINHIIPRCSQTVPLEISVFDSDISRQIYTEARQK